MTLKLKFVKGRNYDTYESKEKKEHKDETVVLSETGEDEEEEEMDRVTYLNNIRQSIFSNAEMYLNNQQIYNSNGLYAHMSYNSNKFRAPISENKRVLHCEVYDYEGERNCQVDLTIGVWLFFQILNCSIQTRKLDCV